MSAAELTKTKTSLIAWIEQLSDDKVLSVLQGVKDSYVHKDWWDDLTDVQQSRLNKSLADAKSGKVVSSEDFWKILKDA